MYKHIHLYLLQTHGKTQCTPANTQTLIFVFCFLKGFPLFFEFSSFRLVSPPGFPMNNPFLLFTQLKCKQWGIRLDHIAG